LVAPVGGLDPTVRVEARVCSACGNRNAPTHRFCTECGGALVDAGPQRSGRTEERIPGRGEAAAGPATRGGSPASQGGADTVRLPSPTLPERAKVTHLVSPDETESHLFQGEFVIGRQKGDLRLPEDPYLSGEHVAIRRRGEEYVLEDLGSTNGTFVRIAGERVLVEGDELMIGRQLFRFTLGIPGPGDGGGPPNRTRALGFGGANPRLVRILEGGETGESWALSRPRTVIGREQGDLVFPDDVLLSAVHAAVLRDPDGSTFRARDEGSRNGIFLRIRQPWPLGEGDVFTAGRQVFRFERAPAALAGQRTVRLDLDPTPLR
jgi:pSer/pThr/pTyr-binding forkhead associated (FHA) protein